MMGVGRNRGCLWPGCLWKIVMFEWSVAVVAGRLVGVTDDTWRCWPSVLFSPWW